MRRRGFGVSLVLALGSVVASGWTAGAQAAAPAGFGVIRASVPTPPTRVYAIGYTGSVRVAWTGWEDGGNPITSVIISDSLGFSWTFSPAPENPVKVIGGLANDVPRTFRVRLVNSDGTSSLSAASNLVAAHSPYPSGSADVTGSMIGDREAAGAVRLADGRVLVVGGASMDPVTWTSTPLATAELYDPATGSWTATGSLPAARTDFTLTRLNSGQVLLAGGYDNAWTPVASAYLYNPSTGTWSVAASMRFPRANPAATLLGDGTALVSGGTTLVHGIRQATATAEVFTPSPFLRIGGTWTTTGAMPLPRTRHSAVRLARNLGSEVLVVGGNDGSGGLRAAVIYHPSTATWTTTGSLVQMRTGDDVGDPTVTALSSGKVLVAGGYYGGPLASAELYNPATGAFSLTASMPIPLQGQHTATLLNSGRVLLVGGVDDWGGLATVQVFDPVSLRWSRGNEVPVEVASQTAVLLADGTVLLAGGLRWMPDFRSVRTAVRYTP